MKLLKGHSYLWIFWIYAVALLGSLVVSMVIDQRPWPLLVMVILLAVLLAVQLRSRLFLSSTWRAEITPDRPYFLMYVIFQALVLLALCFVTCREFDLL